MGDFNNNDAFMRNQNAAVQARTKAQNRANVLQLKLIGQSHPTGLTSNLLKLFEPRPPLEYKPHPEKRKCPPLTGMAQYVTRFAEPGDPEYAPPVQEAETPAQKRARIHKLRLEKGAAKAAEELEKYDPPNDPNISGDPYKTLFAARLSYETSESRVKREFESYGAIKRVRLVTDKATNKPRGYAFIEYLHTRDMKAAYKQADGRKIDGRRVLVDVERGRTVPNWRPRRLGGGLGTTRVGGEEVNQREQQQSRSEEPKVREDRHGDRDREISRERGRDRDREREQSREHSHERVKDRDYKEDRHHRDRDRTRDRDREKVRDRDRGRDRDRDRARDRDRDRERERDRDKGREHDRHHERDRDYEVGDTDRGRSRDRESGFDRVESKHKRDLLGERDRDYEPEDDRGCNNQSEQVHRRTGPDHDSEQDDRYEHHGGRGQYDHGDDHGDHYNQYPDHDRMEDGNHSRHATSESRTEKERNRDMDHEYRHSERSHSKEYDY
ncbi:U1 small nuclear ribonucleoprotein 70 kDa-like isoform X2 [Gastrolobium bilobum]|uniref:U1 small nuclear ribonucleoprotein 70 kDa-like isoform X2 n=1 Tax=Gastrolobium bilobum TaxID=150636 RepID=UPI002AB2A028|nr:U1 small nuclear ribonucleoprotein 70 kDa-like isoform X2 [Gastrolobium bilobum]